MRAWRIKKHGGPEVLHYDLLAQELTPGPGQALIEVQAVGLNHLDLWLQKGVPGHKFPLPMTPGCDIAGKILKLGSGPHPPHLPLGLDVLVNPGTSCGSCQACLGGFDPLCTHFGIIGETQDGGCADQVVVPIQNLIKRPQAISATEGACLGIPFLTAWTMLTRKAQARPGEVVLIQAGGSAVSSAAIQIAKLIGCTVITTVGSDEKIKKAKELGADLDIPYKKEKFRTSVKEFLKALHPNKKGCDVVLDHIGADTFSESLKCLNYGGRLVTCGATSGGEVKLDLKAVFFKNISILGATMGSKSDMI
jgi:NADPH:quinone reductase-like Zn-dependent oxidoreductase